MEEVNSKAMPISCEQLRFQDQGSSEKLGFGHGVGSWERQPRRRSAHEGGRVERGADTKDMWCRNQPLCSPSTASAAKTVSKYPPNLPCFVALGDWGFVVMGWARMTGGVEFEGVDFQRLLLPPSICSRDRGGLSDWERRFEETSAHYHIGEEPARESRDSWSTPPVRPRLERY